MSPWTRGSRQARSIGPTVVALVVAAISLVACGTVFNNDAGTAVAVTYRPKGTGGDSALLKGRLIVEQGCLAVEPEFGEIEVVVLPERKMGRLVGDQIRLFGHNYHLGDQVSFGGGGGGVGGDATVPQGCHPTKVGWAFIAHTM